MTATTRPASPVTLLPDLGAFDGPVVRAVDLHLPRVVGRRVGILATGPSTVDVLANVVSVAARTKVFVVQAVWVVPPRPVNGLLRSVGLGDRAARWALRRGVDDPELRRRLTPRGPAPTVVSERYHHAVQDDRCQLLVWPITAVTASGVRTAEGIEHLLDALVVG